MEEIINDTGEKGKSKLKILIECIATIGTSFAGVFGLWQMFDYIMDGQLLELSQAIALFVLISSIVSIFFILLVLFRNRVIILGSDNNIDNAKKVISESLNYEPAYHLKFVKETGQLYNYTEVSGNPSQERQALLRVKTFNSVLDGIYTYSLNNKQYFADDTDVFEYCDALVRKSGYMCGKRFAESEEKDFRTSVESGEKESRLKAILEKWCEFDSQAGLGNFSVSAFRVIENDGKTDGVSFEIALEKDFVSEGLPEVLEGREEDSNRCQFMRGYCEGVCDVLGKIAYPGYCFKVKKCKPDSCRGEHPDSEKCVYVMNGTKRTNSTAKGE